MKGKQNTTIITTILVISISLSAGTAYAEIPSWVKEVAGFWATGQIDDDEYARTIEYLVTEEIISVPIACTPTPISHDDETKPVITLIGNTHLNMLVNTEYTELGATCVDDVDGEIGVRIDSSNLANYELGYTNIHYSCSDKAGNYDRVMRHIRIHSSLPPDTVAPIITLNGSVLQYMTVNEPYIEQGAICTDNIDGEIIAKLHLQNFVSHEVGTYTIYYSCVDVSGNYADVERKVIVQQETQ